MAFNHAYVRYELGEYAIAVQALESLLSPALRKQSEISRRGGSAGAAAAQSLHSTSDGNGRQCKLSTVVKRHAALKMNTQSQLNLLLRAMRADMR
jgi:hypothetical protein